MVPIAITHADDPRLGDYRDLKERHLNTLGGRFIAESERVVRRLLASGLRVHSLLATPARLATLADALALRPPPGTGGDEDRFPVYVVAQMIMDRIAGFHVHRGCLAVGERPAEAAVPADARTVVVLEDLVDVDNLGAVARNAAALGAGALCLSPGCADPFYRKAIRVSLGAVFFLPVVRFARWPDDLLGLRAAGFQLVAATPRAGATPLPAFVRPERMALLLGSEGPGLSSAVLDLADQLVAIPMAASGASMGVDSLNVATAGAVILYALGEPSAKARPNPSR
ncbi:MAG TPA: RNA methyltransferase [Polyangia bacterium]|nr:RNA methyltransferase [Polyangia bacterium]